MIDPGMWGAMNLKVHRKMCVPVMILNNTVYVNNTYNIHTKRFFCEFLKTEI